MSEGIGTPLRLVLSSVLVAVVDSPTRPVLLSVVGGTGRGTSAAAGAGGPAAAGPGDPVVVPLPRRPGAHPSGPTRPDGPSAA